MAPNDSDRPLSGERINTADRPRTASSPLAAKLQRWADGKGTLKDVRGYSSEELYAVAKTAYFFFYQGRLNEARVLFQGLYTIDPLDAYFAKALGVVELAAGNVQGALSAYDVAIKLAPSDPAAYVGRAEVKLYQGNKAQAAEDLRKAISVSAEASKIRAKAWSMLQSITASGPRGR
jgi:type III secretion system low calcium response chaperone LcrH/SycD